MKAIRVLGVVVLFLAGCPFSSPEPDPMQLRPPAPPRAEAGEIRVFGASLPVERAREIRTRLRKAERRLIAAYENILAVDSFASGTLQLRIGVNREGEVASISRIVSDVNSREIDERIPALIRDVDFGPGPEAYVFYTVSFQPDPFEVVRVRPEFDSDPPALAADVLNRSAFHLSSVAVTVSVQRPDRAAPLRISRRRIRADFEPLGRRIIRVPVGTEWASERYSFLVDVRPDVGEE